MVDCGKVNTDDGLCAVIDNLSIADMAPKKHEEEEIVVLTSDPTRGHRERIERAWRHWRSIGEPKFMVAPMVDNSELPFRMLCRKYGANAAYTPMLHSRIFSENEKYRSSEFSTCKV